MAHYFTPHATEAAMNEIFSMQSKRSVPAAPASSPDADAAVAAGGLLHLVEAATALSKLGSAPVTAPLPAAAARAPVVSESDESSSSSASCVSTLISPLSPPVRKTGKNRSSGKRKGSRAHKASKAKTGTTKHKSFKAKTKASSKSSLSSNSSSPQREAFPRRLMRMLASPTVASASVITWLPHGLSFVILRPDVFAERILPMYFPESASDGRSSQNKPPAAKYPSFTRKLNRWGFRQIARGPDAGAFHHHLFRRDMPQLCDGMECQKSRKSQSSASSANAKPSSAKEKRSCPASTAKALPQDTYASSVPVTPVPSSPASPMPAKKRRSATSKSNSPGGGQHQMILNLADLRGHPGRQHLLLRPRAGTKAVSSTISSLPPESAAAAAAATLLRRAAGPSSFEDDVSAITNASGTSSVASSCQQSNMSSASMVASAQPTILDALLANCLQAEQQQQQQQQLGLASVGNAAAALLARHNRHAYEPGLHQILRKPSPAPIAPRPVFSTGAAASSSALPPSSASSVSSTGVVHDATKDAKNRLYQAYLEALKRSS